MAWWNDWFWLRVQRKARLRAADQLEEMGKPAEAAKERTEAKALRRPQSQEEIINGMVESLKQQGRDSEIPQLLAVMEAAKKSGLIQ